MFIGLTCCFPIDARAAQKQLFTTTSFSKKVCLDFYNNKADFRQQCVESISGMISFASLKASNNVLGNNEPFRVMTGLLKTHLFIIFRPIITIGAEGIKSQFTKS